MYTSLCTPVANQLLSLSKMLASSNVKAHQGLCVSKLPSSLISVVSWTLDFKDHFRCPIKTRYSSSHSPHIDFVDNTTGLRGSIGSLGFEINCIL